MEFVTANSGDLERVFELYEEAIKFQRTVFDKTWLGFDREMVEIEIAEDRLWKIVIDGAIACIFSVTYRDPILWGADSDKAAMYIHRIVTNPDFRGRGFVWAITDWAIEHARENALRYVRMDTWGDNRKLVDYYQQCGFRLVGTVEPEDSATLPKHYSAITLALFEIDLETHP